ncbi:MAG: HTH domain-containing protein [Oscillospiraceae bacterium]|nr:HTH domain-containing protein [Oscillospiraceae bacterium]
MIKKPDKTFRVLSISDRLLDGSELSIETLAKEFGVSIRTVRRDINALREYIAESDNATQNAVAYNESKNTYFLIKPEREWVTAEEAIDVTEILLESDKFSKEQAAGILHKIITQVDPAERDTARKAITKAYESYK